MHDKRRMGYRGILLFVGVFMIGIGIWRGEMDMVLGKAVNICLECVGIG